MKTIILAGGRGTRLAGETERKPKPMVDIGGRPILWHLMQHYSTYGYDEFVVALGYLGEVVKQYFLTYQAVAGDLHVDLQHGRVDVKREPAENWRIDLVDTGQDTETGGRLRRLAPHIEGQRFMMTYGDGLSSVDLSRLVAFHEEHGRLATVLAVRPPARFGGLTFDGDVVTEFVEKPQLGEGWISGGFFVLEPDVLEYIDGDHTAFERSPLARLAKDRQLLAFRHEGFWQCVDTPRDLQRLQTLWSDGGAPWLK